jgi:hypothetical protein
MSMKGEGTHEDNRGSDLVEIRVRGHLHDRWADWFGGMTIVLEENGDTTMTGPIVDQAALHGLLKKVRDLGMPLLSVNRVLDDNNRFEGRRRK